MHVISLKTLIGMSLAALFGLSIGAGEGLSHTYNGLEVITPSEANHVAGGVRATRGYHKYMINGSGLVPTKAPRHGLDMTHEWQGSESKNCWLTAKSESKNFFRDKNVVDPVVVFVLPAEYEVSGVALWNYPGSYDEEKRKLKDNDRGVQLTVWEIGESAEGPWQPLGQKLWAKGGKDRKKPEKAQVAQFGSAAKGTHVRMTVKSNYRGNYVGIAEIRFLGTAVPAEPAALPAASLVSGLVH